jgi:hypothetical protein
MKQSEQSPIYTGLLLRDGKEEPATLFLTPHHFHVDVTVLSGSKTAEDATRALASYFNCQPVNNKPYQFLGGSSQSSRLFFISSSNHSFILIGYHVIPNASNKLQLGAPIYSETLSFNCAIEYPYSTLKLDDDPLFTSMTEDFSHYSSWFGMHLVTSRSLSNDSLCTPIELQQPHSKASDTKAQAQEQSQPSKLIIYRSTAPNNFDSNSQLYPNNQFRTHIRLESKVPLPYQEFHDKFGILKRLLEIAYEQPLPSSEIHARPCASTSANTAHKQDENSDSFDQDPRFYDNWAISDAPLPSLGNPLFSFDDIGNEVIKKWIKLFYHFSGGLSAFCAEIESPAQTPYETRVILTSCALEYLGSQMLTDYKCYWIKNIKNKGKHPAHFHDQVATIIDSLSQTGFIDIKHQECWTQTITKMYNGTKHFDRTGISAEEGYAYLLEAIRLIRYWVAYQIDCPLSIIAKDIQRHQNYMIVGDTTLAKSLFKVPEQEAQQTES